MTQYAVLWAEKTKTLTIKEEGDKPLKDVFTHIYMAQEGEIPDNFTHPAPGQHLVNMVNNLGIDYRFVTVKNATKNERLDKFEQDGEDVTEEDETVLVVNDKKEEMKAPQGV